MSSGGRGKNFRRRTDETGDDNDDNTNGNTNSIVTKSLPPSKPKKKPPSLLSFADEEGEEAIKPSLNRSRDREKTNSSRSTKPSSSHKITTSKDRRNFSSLPSNVQPQAGTYTKEALLELQKNTRTLAAPSHPQGSSEPKIVLKGLLKLQTGEDATAGKKDKGDTESRLASMEIGKEGDSSVIMDKAAILLRWRQKDPASRHVSKKVHVGSYDGILDGQITSGAKTLTLENLRD